MLFSQLATAKDTIRISSKAWEIGAGASIFQFNRVDFTNFSRLDDQYKFNIQIKHNVIGPNLYIAREITNHLYIDIQGSMGFTSQYKDGRTKSRSLFMVGPGLQWRLGEYFNSKYVDPFFRVGVNYLRKNFDMKYTGVEGDMPEEMTWILENIQNKDGEDRNKLFPIAFGAGLNAWLNDRVGIGLQADYLHMPHKNIANSLQGTARLIFRIGGKSKKTAPIVKYVEVEKIVKSAPEIIEKIIEVPVEVEKNPSIVLCELFNSIYFDFDKADIKPESETVLNKISDIIKGDTLRGRYLITGYTDSKGNDLYNIELSRKRAAAIVDALEKRGVPSAIIKSRGVGKKISYAPDTASSEIREGDRKVTVELITNDSYWNYIPKRDF